MSEQDLRDYFASAIRLDADKNPRVVAQGSGDLARKITRIAQQYDVPVLQNFALSKRLSAISLGDEIPKSLYAVIAELFAYLMLIEEKTSDE